MSLLAHCGHPRQGKTYSAVVYIIEQLARGRRVVTNIEGMGTDKRRAKLRALVEKAGGTWSDERFVHVPHSQVEKALIFPVDMKREDDEGIRMYDDSKSILRYGDALVWDEARLWKTGKLPELWSEALDYHGHWSRGGFSTDILIITPAWMNLAPAVRRLVEVLYLFEKHPGGKGFTRWLYKAPGDRDIQPPNGALDTETFAYDPEVFECYATNNDPESIAADTLIKPLWRTWRFWKKVIIGGGLILFGVAGLYLLGRSFFSSNELDADNPSSSAQSAASSPNGSSSAGGLGAFAGAAPADQHPRVVGIIPAARGGRLAVVKIGERYDYARIEAGAIKYKGEMLLWPDAY